jgi:putative transposase
MIEQHGMSVSRACSSARLSRAAYYKPVRDRSQADAEIVSALNEIVAVELRWGFWKCFDRLRHLGRRWNHKRVHRVYCQMRLNQKRRTKKRVLQRPRQPLHVTTRPNEVWALDFMHDRLYSGRPFRTFNVIDEADRGGLGIEVATSIPASRVIRFMEQLIEIHGKPSAIRCDNGSDELRVHRVVPGQGHPDPIHSARQARSERFHRTFQPDLPGGGPDTLLVRFDRGRAPDHRRLAGPLQRNQAARRAGKPATGAIPRAVARSGNSTLKLST